MPNNVAGWIMKLEATALVLNLLSRNLSRQRKTFTTCSLVLRDGTKLIKSLNNITENNNNVNFYFVGEGKYQLLRGSVIFYI